MTPSFAFIVIATLAQPWQKVLRDGPEATWVNNLNENEHFLAAYSDGALGKSEQDIGNHQKIVFDQPQDKRWEISSPAFIKKSHAMFSAHSGYGGLIPTTISAISYLGSTFNPDFIIRTNVSSYWNIRALRNLLSLLPSEGVYAGVTGDAFSGLTGLVRNGRYVSGAGMILSRDVYSEMIFKRDKFDLECIDDLSIGRTLSGLKIKPTELARIDLRHIWDIGLITPGNIKSNFHYRCKSVHRIGAREIRRDVPIMQHLHRVLEKIKE